MFASNQIGCYGGNQNDMYLSCRSCDISFSTTRYSMCPLCNEPFPPAPVPLEALVVSVPNDELATDPKKLVTVVADPNKMLMLYTPGFDSARLCCVELKHIPPDGEVWVTDFSGADPDIAATVTGKIGTLKEQSYHENNLSAVIKYRPMQFCCTDREIFTLDCLERSLATLDFIKCPFRLQHLLEYCSHFRMRHTWLGVCLSINKVVMNTFGINIHKPRGVARTTPIMRAYLVLAPVPGVPMLSETNPMPDAKWKTINSKGYEWLFIYSPEKQSEMYDYLARCRSASSSVLYA